MVYHVLNGDALIDRFLVTGLRGERVVARECLIEGDLSGETLDAFYRTRAHYLAVTYKDVEKRYYDEVVSEFDKLTAATSPSEFNLWFGYDLFCRTNMWFILSLLHDLPIDKQVFVIYPYYLKGYDIWLDYGAATPEQLMACYNNRIAFTGTDLQLASDLWQAYKNNDLATLQKLSRQSSPCFPYLEEVCQAHIDRFTGDGGMGRPERVIKQLLEGPNNDFPAVFSAFYQQEGVYGFGDSQVKRIYDRLLQSR